MRLISFTRLTCILYSIVHSYIKKNSCCIIIKIREKFPKSFIKIDVEVISILLLVYFIIICIMALYYIHCFLKNIWHNIKYRMHSGINLTYIFIESETILGHFYEFLFIVECSKILHVNI